MHSDIRLVAADFDGTLLSRDGSISPFNQMMIKKAQDKGIIFAAATGRYAENAGQIMLDAGIVCPVISTNGAVVELAPYGPRILEKSMDKAAALAVFKRLEQLGEGYHIFSRGRVDNRRDWPRHISESDAQQLKKLKAHVAYRYGLEACLDALQHPIHKFFAYFSTDRDDVAQVGQAFLDIPGIEITQSGRHNLEFMPAGTSKGSGLQALAAHYGLASEQVMALGDHLNDLSMLTWAGLGVAMANAVPEVLAAADAVTDSHDQDGVGKAIQKYCRL